MNPKLASCLLAAVCAIWLGGCASQSHATSNTRLGNVLQQEHDANAAYLAGDMQRAAQLYGRLVEAVPGEADYWYRLGNAHFRLQQPDQAVADYGHAIALKPDHARAWHNLGIVRLKQAQAAMLASARSAKTDDPLRAASERVVARLAHVGDDTRTPDAPTAASDSASSTPPPTAAAAATSAATTPVPGQR